MFTWWKLYKSVPYESVVKGLSVDTKGERPEFCDDELNEQSDTSEQETDNGR